jgi:hypothetical protein
VEIPEVWGKTHTAGGLLKTTDVIPTSGVFPPRRPRRSSIASNLVVYSFLQGWSGGGVTRLLAGPPSPALPIPPVPAGGTSARPPLFYSFGGGLLAHFYTSGPLIPNLEHAHIFSLPRKQESAPQTKEKAPFTP